MPYEFVDDSAGRYQFVDEQPKGGISRVEKVLRGVADPVDGGAQLLTHLLPGGVVNAGNRLNNWIADKTGLVGKIPEGGIDQSIAEQEKAYQAKRAAAGESGFDGYRVLGNVISPANAAIASKIPVGATLASRVGFGAVGGAGTSLLNPVAGDDFWSGKGQQVATGAAFGGAVPVVAGGVSRIISPNASKNANIDLLKAEGVRPTIGQTLGGRWNALEEKAQSLPIVGDAITLARQRSGQDLNAAAYRRALDPIGVKLPASVQLGGDAVEFTRKSLGQAYDDLLPKIATQADDPFVSSLSNLKAMVSGSAMDPKYSAQFEKILNTRVLDKFQGQNAMTGQTLKDVQSHLTNEIKRFGASQDPDARLLSQALKEVGASLDDLVIRSNPQYADQLKAINTGWANFKRVQKAAGYLGADDGLFTPAQLQGAVRAADRSKDKARFAEGNALMQDLSGAGKAVLTNKVPDSGTAARAMYGVGALASGIVNPAIPAGLLGGAAMYTPQAQALLRTLASSRGQSAEAMADALRQTAPFLVPGGAQVGLGLLN